MRRALVLLTAAVSVGCVSTGTYDEKVRESDKWAMSFKDEKAQREALEKKVAELQARIADVEAALTNKEAERRALADQNAQLQALNDELSRSKKKLAEAKEELEKKSSEYEGLANSLKSEIDAGKVELSELKGKMTVKMKDKILFASGSTKIGKEGIDALDKVAGALKTLKGKIIRVEGHTDDVPTDPKGPFPSNWELSLARAMAVVRHIQDRGVDPTALSAAGYGPYHPLAANDSPENRSQNRRIEIVLAAAH